MKSVERVQAAIAHQEPDRVPKGEFWLTPALARRLIKKEISDPFACRYQAMEMLGFDLVAVEATERRERQVGYDNRGRQVFLDCWGRSYQYYQGEKSFVAPPDTPPGHRGLKVPDPEQYSWSEVGRWREHSDMFTFALIDGVYQIVFTLFDFNDFLLNTLRQPDFITETAFQVADFLVSLGLMAVECGAHGIIIGDDFAYNAGTFIAPQSLRQIFFPALKRVVDTIKGKGIPVFLHVDGNVEEVLPDIVQMGFDGLHSLEPSAGMDIERVKADYGTQLCLMGNIDLQILAEKSVTEVESVVKETIRVAAPGGGYIFSSASGILSEHLPPENVMAMYGSALEYGRYPLATSNLE